MKRLHTFAVLLLAAFAFPAFAFRARPVSDLRFEEFPGIPAAAAASDGNDYLVLLQAFVGNTYAQIISQGVPYGPAVLIGKGNGGSVVWNGSEYLVLWGDDNGIYLSEVSRRGALLSGPKVILSGKAIGAPVAVSNGRKILLTVATATQITGTLLDLTGQTIGKPFSMISFEYLRPGAYAITGTRDGFALGLFGPETRIFRFDDAGVPAVAGGTLIETHTYQGVLASDGTNVMALFSTFDTSQTLVLKTAVVGPRGDIVQPSRFMANNSPVGTLLWNGSEYISARSIKRSVNYSTQTQVFIQRISDAGELFDTELLQDRPYEVRYPPFLASNGREYLIALDGSFMRLPIGASTPSDDAVMSRSVNNQEALAIARGRQDFLAVWRESEPNRQTTIRASRVDALGRYLDGTGIVVARFSSIFSQPTTSVDTDGQNWLVVWSYDGSVYGCRVSPDGVPIDSEPFLICGGWGAVVRWSGNSWLVVSNQQWRMAATTVTSNGLVGPVKTFDPMPAALQYSPYVNYTDPVLAFDGRDFVVAFGLQEGELGDGHVFYDFSLMTERLSANGDSLMTSSFFLPLRYSDLSLSVATNGSQTLVVFGGSGKVEGLLLDRRGYAPTTTVIEQVPQPFTGYQLETATSWNGSEFVVASFAADGTVRITHTSALGYRTDTATLPHDPAEHIDDIVFPPSAPSGQTDELLGLLTRRDDAYAQVSRAELAFASDVIDARAVQTVPVAPILLKAIGDATGINLTWQPQDGILGFEIELRQSDGSDRVIGIAAGSASSTHISYGGQTGTAIRLRAWNAAGLSAPSSEMPLITPRVHAAR